MAGVKPGTSAPAASTFASSGRATPPTLVKLPDMTRSPPSARSVPTVPSTVGAKEVTAPLVPSTSPRFLRAAPPNRANAPPTTNLLPRAANAYTPVRTASVPGFHGSSAPVAVSIAAKLSRSTEPRVRKPPPTKTASPPGAKAYTLLAPPGFHAPTAPPASSATVPARTVPLAAVKSPAT